MGRWLWTFACDESGYVTGPEWAFVATILVLVAITGVVAVRQASNPDGDPPMVLRAR